TVVGHEAGSQRDDRVQSLVDIERGFENGTGVGEKATSILRLPPLRNLEHPADHADRLAALATDDAGPVEDGGVGSVAPAKTVLRGPGGGEAIERRLNAGHDTIPIVRVDSLDVPIDGGAHLVRRVPEAAWPSIVPGEGVGRHVPDPEHVLGCRLDEVEHLLATAQRALGPTRLGHVREDGVDLDEPPLLVKVSVLRREDLCWLPVDPLDL